MKDLDDSAENYARSMNVTYEEALKVRNEMSAVAGITKGQIMEASIAVNKELGTSGQLTEDNAAAFAKLQVRAGMTAEELQGITSLSLTNGKNIKQNTNEFIAQAKAISAGKGVVLNEKQLMADIGKISKATTLTLGKNPKE
jgi:excinuclease UvrABC nuclease subunit